MKVMTVLVLSISMLVGFFGAVHARPPRPSHPPREPDLAQRLGLKPRQENDLKASLRRSTTEADRIREALIVERGKLRELYDDYNLDHSRARGLITKINKLQLDLLESSLERQISLRRILNPRQFALLNKIIVPEPPDAGELRFPRPGGPRDRPPGLKLSPEQQEAVEKLWWKRRGESDAATLDMAHDLKAITRLYENYRLDVRAVKKLIQNVNKAQLRMMDLRFDRQVEQRKILTEQQFRELKQHMRLLRPLRPDR